MISGGYLDRLDGADSVIEDDFSKTYKITLVGDRDYSEIKFLKYKGQWSSSASSDIKFEKVVNKWLYFLDVDIEVLSTGHAIMPIGDVAYQIFQTKGGKICFLVHHRFEPTGSAARYKKIFGMFLCRLDGSQIAKDDIQQMLRFISLRT
jgi:hypothetical protein